MRKIIILTIVTIIYCVICTVAGHAALYLNGVRVDTGGGSGDVVGPASSTDNAICRYDSTTGKLLQNSTSTIDDDGKITHTATLNDATGNEFAQSLFYQTNKASSGNDTGLIVSQRDTASPGTSYLFRAGVNTDGAIGTHTDKFTVDNGGSTRIGERFLFLPSVGQIYFGYGVANTADGDAVYLPKTNGRAIRFATDGDNTNTSGNPRFISIEPTYNQTSGTSANTDLLINRTQTAVGSGTQLLIDAQVGGTSKFKVDNSGNVTSAGINASGRSFFTAGDSPTVGLTPTFTLTSKAVYVLSISPTYNQPGNTYPDTDLLINRTETEVGSGPQNLADFQVGSNSQLRFTNKSHIVTAGADPAISSCGTSPSIVGSDTAGIVTVGGGGAVTACTLTFATAFVNEPACTITPQSNATAYLSASATSAITVTFSADVQSAKFNYICMGL